MTPEQRYYRLERFQRQLIRRLNHVHTAEPLGLRRGRRLRMFREAIREGDAECWNALSEAFDWPCAGALR